MKFKASGSVIEHTLGTKFLPYLKKIDFEFADIFRLEADLVYSASRQKQLFSTAAENVVIS